MVSGVSGLESLQTLQFQKDQVIFKEGDSDFSFFMIQEGQVEVFTYDINKKKVSLATLGPGQPVGEFAMIARQPRSATAQALTAVTAVKISEEGYKNLLSEIPEWATYLIRSLVDRLRATDELLRNQNAKDQRVAKIVS